MQKKVIIGLSGGVDSSVAAWLLKEQGYDVTALFMINWKDSSVTLSGDCSWEEDIILAQLVARKIGIPLEVVDSTDKYKESVVEYMFSEYEKGRTPNPDVLCNREIKFDVFHEAARKFGADYIATGHYARTEKLTTEKGEVTRLLAGTDSNKDQSYFLCQLSQEQLNNVLFPIGDIDKPEVRRIAAKLELASAHKKDSQGICFVGKVDLPTFLQQKLAPKTGQVIEIDENDPVLLDICRQFDELDKSMPERVCGEFDFSKMEGTIAGEHPGAHYYTVGQRKGLNIGGKLKPLFVLGTDVEKNIVYVGQGHDHPGLNRKGLFIAKDEIHWIRPDLALQPGEEKKCRARIRYRQELQDATLMMRENGLYILFDQLQRGVAAGQFAAWYYDDEVVGSGVIR
ncbi:MAG: tRNA 2-thiouridine(34) synthase MnmA [Bacteroidetes bacterium]|nr:MAG: tRNA 2-thiouridine(34) synthase MnmA [Bacteroidota bacterium]